MTAAEKNGLSTVYRWACFFTEFYEARYLLRKPSLYEILLSERKLCSDSFS
jgi:hypothetical protein